MKLDNGILQLELTNLGGEMASLKWHGKDILYKGDGPYWKGKNPTLFPFISGYKGDEYILDNKAYSCEKHGFIRQSKLDIVTNNENEVTMRLCDNEYTIKRYPFKFQYGITYSLDNNKVLIDYEIVNKDHIDMPFTFGIHPGFIVSDFNKARIIFNDDKEARLFKYQEGVEETVPLGVYEGSKLINDICNLETVMLKDIKSKEIILETEEYSVKVDISKFKYLAFWTANKDANYLCIEPWISMNEIWNSDTPFRADFELEHLKPNEKFNINYSIEII